MKSLLQAVQFCLVLLCVFGFLAGLALCSETGGASILFSFLSIWLVMEIMQEPWGL